MAFSFWLAPIAALLPLVASAETIAHQHVPDVATSAYGSPLDNYRPYSVPHLTPDQAWLQRDSTPSSDDMSSMPMDHAAHQSADHAHHHGE